jgi:hypothetical protein
LHSQNGANMYLRSGAWKAGKSRTAGKSETAESSSDMLSESSDEEEDPQELIVQEVSLH